MNVSQREQAFFQDFSALLKKHADMDGKFSLWRVHQHHSLEDDEILHETSDLEQRTSTVRAIKKTELPEAAFASQWLIKADGSVEAAVWCCD